MFFLKISSPTSVGVFQGHTLNVFSSHMWGLSVAKCLYSFFLTSVGILILNNFLYFTIDFSEIGCYNKRVNTLNFEICGCGGIGRHCGLKIRRLKDGVRVQIPSPAPSNLIRFEILLTIFKTGVDKRTIAW